MKLGLMQPYCLPYIGYWQLMNAVDIFIVYDNIKYTKKGWINRNRYLLNGTDAYFTVPLKNASDYLNVDERTLSPDFKPEKLLNKIASAYHKAPYYHSTYTLIEQVFMCDEVNLFRFILNSIQIIRRTLGITSRLVISSSLNVDAALKAQERVIATCKAVGADTYINPIGGTELYSKEVFAQENIKLMFHKCGDIRYPQFGETFLPNLSILDVMMFNPPEKIREMLDNYTLE